MTLIIPYLVWLKMLCYARQSLPDEVTGIGLIEPLSDPDGRVRSFIVQDIFIAPQRVSPGYCEFEDDALHNIYSDLIEAGRSTDVPKLRFRWHSHGDGSVFFSTIDAKDIEDNKLNVDWMVSIVINARKDHIARLDTFEPFRMSVPLEVDIMDQIPKEMLDRCRLEVVQMSRPYEGKHTPRFDEKVDSQWNGFNQIPAKGGENRGKNLFRPGEIV